MAASPESVILDIAKSVRGGHGVVVMMDIAFEAIEVMQEASDTMLETVGLKRPRH